MIEWKSIDTAPKDGTEVLVTDIRDEDKIVYIGRFAGYWWVEGGQVTAQPTHWMPLPEAPK